MTVPFSEASRRFGFAVVAAVALACPALATSGASTDVTQFRMNAANNAVVGGNLRAAWTFETGGPISASPTVVDGVYTSATTWAVSSRSTCAPGN